ncbi:MAG TPA: OmpA family protein, partial [Dyella sp.]
MHFHRQFVVLSLATLAVAMSGCQGYVKKTDFDSAISELRANDQKQQQEIDNLTQQMERRMAGYDAKIAQMKGRVRV